MLKLPIQSSGWNTSMFPMYLIFTKLPENAFNNFPGVNFAKILDLSVHLFTLEQYYIRSTLFIGLQQFTYLKTGHIFIPKNDKATFNFCKVNHSLAVGMKKYKHV